MNTAKKTVARILTLVLALCLMMSLAAPAMASDANEEIMDAQNAVVQIQVWFVDPETAVEWHLSNGTGFLINENTVITNEHVVYGFSDAWYAQWALDSSQFLGRERTAEEIKQKLELRVIVLRDVYVKAKIRQYSKEMDYAILTLEDKLYNRTTLPLRSSSTLKQTEPVYALGFPGEMDDIASLSTYTADDVTVTSGNVNKVASMTFYADDGMGGIREYNNVEMVEHGALINAGNSGGPLLDKDGNVVGINVVNSSTRNLAVTSDQLIATLDALGIPYEKADKEPEPTQAPTEAPTEAPKATEAPTEAPTQAPVATEAPVVTEPAKIEEPVKDNTMMIILIAVAVAVVVIVAVVVVVMSKGKKTPPSAPSGGYVPPAPPRAPAASSTGFTSINPAPVHPTAPMDAGETTVLNQGAGETTLLSRNVNGGTLIRKRNGETVKVNTETFVIGRERKSVNYCIADNSSISRNHVKLNVRGGITYLIDMGAANGTFVNGVKVMPRQEIALKNGDKITLADEELEYKN